MHNISFLSNWSANFNGDFSGDVVFVSPDGEKHTVPFYALAAVVAEKIRRDRISAIEKSNDEDVLK